MYLADDVTLRRRVAVKILHPALAAEPRFLDRFRAEATTVASVNHPNILLVYDSGVDGLPYLVTEYLGGGSMRGMLAAGHRLTPSQALLVGLEACRGLAHAHERGLVHRDLKPANLLFGEDARLRIADFGIARALAETGMTVHDGLVGTVRYASPEQASGTSAGPKADVYALALSLVEAVTGDVPFAADDPLATLRARTTGDLVVPEALGPLRGPLEQAGRLDPDERADAEALGISLLAASERLEAPGVLPLVGALAEAGAPDRPDERTQVAPVVAGTASGGSTGGSPATAEAPGGRRRWPILLAVAALLAVVGAAAAVFVATRTTDPEVPDLVGRQLDDIELIAEQNEWVVDDKETRQDGTEPGEIVSTEPAAGESLAEGGTLVVLVSLGNELTDRPTELVGRPLSDVIVDLDRAGLDYDVTEVFDEEVPDDHVIGTDGEVDERLPKGEVVPLLVSMGPEPRTIPSFGPGLSYEEVAGALDELGLVPTRADVFDEDTEPGVVLAVDPAPGQTVDRGSEVRVTVSKGPDVVTVPDVEGMSLDEAEAALEARGLFVENAFGFSRGEVIGSDPPAGTTVRRGAGVTLFLVR